MSLGKLKKYTNLLNVCIKGRDIVDTSIEFFDSLSPPSSEPVGTFHPKHAEMSVADDKSQVLTGSGIFELFPCSTKEKRDLAQKTAFETDKGRTEGLMSTRTSIHNIGMHFHSLNSKDAILLCIQKHLQQLSSFSSASMVNKSSPIFSSSNSCNFLLLNCGEQLSIEPIKAAASDTIIACMRSKAGCLREL